MRILILEHEPEAPAALLGEWARVRGHEQSVAPVPRLEAWPDPREYHAIVSLGSDSSVHDRPHAWVAPELELLRNAHEHDVPILGICFGGQALSKALGGAVRLAPQPEVRWGWIDTDEPELVMPGPWFSWHRDEFTTPAGARLLAGTALQTTGFSWNRSLALQYHPEVDGALASSWVGGGRAKLTELGVDISELREQIVAQAPGARERAFEQFDRIAAWWSRSSSLERPQRAHKERR
jgi:GMP synthase-like glutamine amidotransferase